MYYMRHVLGSVSRRFMGGKAANRKKTAPPTSKKKTSKVKKNIIEPLTPMQMFVKDVDPGFQRRRKGKTTQGETDFFKGKSTKAELSRVMKAPTRLREESTRRNLKDHNTVYVFRKRRGAIPELVYYEDEDMFLMYDASADAEYRLLVFPRRLFPFPEDLNLPHLPNLVKTIEQLGEVNDVLSKENVFEEASVAFHVKLGNHLHSKPFRVIFQEPAEGAKKVGPREITQWLVRHRRMSIDSHRMMKDYLVRYKDYYRLGSRFDLMPPYQPVQGPSE